MTERELFFISTVAIIVLVVPVYEFAKIAFGRRKLSRLRRDYFGESSMSRWDAALLRDQNLRLQKVLDERNQLLETYAPALFSPLATGDRVRCVGGPYAGRTGRVVRVFSVEGGPTLEYVFELAEFEGCDAGPILRRDQLERV